MTATTEAPSIGASAARTVSEGAHAERMKFVERIGSITFIVSARCTGMDTITDKLVRLTRSVGIEDSNGRGGTTERNEYPPQGGCSEAQSVPTKREVRESA
jgi:hypothetical protein